MHEDNKILNKISKKHIKAIAAHLGLPVGDIKKVVNDLKEMDLLRINQNHELEVFDGREWQKIRL